MADPVTLAVSVPLLALSLACAVYAVWVLVADCLADSPPELPEPDPGEYGAWERSREATARILAERGRDLNGRPLP